MAVRRDVWAHEREEVSHACREADLVRLDDVLEVLAALERAGVRYAVFGGLRDRDDAMRLARMFDLDDDGDDA